MKVSRRKLLVTHMSLAAVLALSCNIACAKLADSLEVTNQTNLNLGTSAAGWSGNGISANSSAAISTTRISMGCFFGAALSNCPIEFTDLATGNKVATVFLDTYSGALLGAPTFHGGYASEYDVIGWQDNPLSHIYIIKKDSHAHNEDNGSEENFA